MGWDRNNKLNAIIQEKVAHIVLFRLKDPRLGFVTITKAKLSKDHSQCDVYYSVLGTAGDRSATQHALNDACGHVQTEIGRTLRMRQTPHLRFIFDESIEGTMRVNTLLKELSDERARREPEAATKGDVEGDSDATGSEIGPGSNAKNDEDETAAPE